MCTEYITIIYLRNNKCCQQYCFLDVEFCLSRMIRSQAGLMLQTTSNIYNSKACQCQTTLDVLITSSQGQWQIFFVFSEYCEQSWFGRCIIVLSLMWSNISIEQSNWTNNINMWVIEWQFGQHLNLVVRRSFESSNEYNLLHFATHC